jgi:hypothetical protein
MPIVVRISIGLLALLFAGLAFLISDSIVYPWGGTFGAGLALCAVIIGLICIFAGHRWTAGLFTIISLAAVWQVATPWIDGQAVLVILSSATTTLRQFGSLFGMPISGAFF